ncbi:MAG: hypothetical protein CSA23_03385 [Deltaproteobacteria bacterium]|nr:MAG: hypothetical protein CSA23_03385 [Deltaproteobacteria bacterium]
MKRWLSRKPFALVAVLAAVLLMPMAGFVQAETSPSINPPRMERNPPRALTGEAALNGNTSQTAWTYHKTDDGSHPDGDEQQLIWLMNKARANPTAEGIWLATVNDSQIQGAVRYFDVDLPLMQQEFAAIAPKPPGAWDVRLYEAARMHSEYLISIDAQNHDGQFGRVNEAGFLFTAGRASVFSYAETALHCHAAWNIDWGTSSDGSGMQDGRGHRMATMAADGEYTNVGIAVVPESLPGTEVGPLVVTGNYAKAQSGRSDHFNRFIVGTVWDDLDGDAIYDPGEGRGGISVTPDHGTYYAVTGAAGGFAIPILTAGDYTVTIQGPGIQGDIEENVSVAADSVLLDIMLDETQVCDTDDRWATIAGSIVRDGTPLCAMVLANGQFMFSCGGGDDLGHFELYVPLDTNGEITIQVFVSGLAPHREIIAACSPALDIEMQPASSGSRSPAVTMDVAPDPSGRSNWRRIAGFVDDAGTPLCAMVLANGQFMFSCDKNLGSYDLTVPLDANGKITHYVFASGYQPYKSVFLP